jgi:hypothetical protein
MPRMVTGDRSMDPALNNTELTHDKFMSFSLLLIIQRRKSCSDAGMLSSLLLPVFA